MSQEEPAIIGGYRLMRLMYQGQASQVWEVAELKSQLHFAMKILLPETMRESEHRKYILHEYAVGTKLKHKNIIRIVKLFKSKDNPYLVSEYFPSVNLGARIKHRQQRSLNPNVDHSKKTQHELLTDEARYILEQIAMGLAHIHGQGFVHRDLKPDNILVNSTGEVRIVDFAITRPMDKTGLLGMFRTRGPVQGTKSYMAPEQIKNKPLDARADLYCFGVTMYELVAGRLPFVGMSPGELLNKQLYEKPAPPQAYNPKVSDDCSKLIMRMLAKDKKDRPSDLNEFLVNLNRIKIFKDEKVVRKKPKKAGTE